MKKALGMLVSLAVLALVVLSACTMAVRGQEDHQYVIIPGDRIGNWTLDRTLESYIQEFGNPERVEVIEGTTIYNWLASRGIRIWTRTNSNVVVQIDIVTHALGQLYAARNPQVVALQRKLERYRTPEGLSLGQSAARVKALHGEPAIVPLGETDSFRFEGFVYLAKGLWVTIVEPKATPGTVFLLGVFRPNAPGWW